MKILLLGLGNVNQEVLNFLKKIENIKVYVYKKNIKQNYENIKFLKSYKEVLNPDLVIEALPGKTEQDVDYAYSILKEYSSRKADIVSCNKQLIQKYGSVLCYSANNNNSKLMLSSLMCTSDIVDNSNFLEYTDEELYKNRNIGPKETAMHMIRDIKIILKEKNV